jgi:PRTRC genetic system protein B
MAVPAELGIPPDPIRVRLVFHHQSILLYDFGDGLASTRIVSAHDISEALASELSFGTGLLPENTLWWRNTRIGPVFALYEEPKIRTLSLQRDIGQEVRRFRMPLPGFIFLLSPGRAPWVYAVKKRPQSERDKVYKAPLYNVYQTGFTCAGSNKYPTDVSEMVQNFFASFFTRHLANDKRIQSEITMDQFWESLDGKRRFPLKELVEHGVVADLMRMDMEGGVR